MSVKINDPEMDGLRADVEKKFGMKMTLPRYFTQLSAAIMQEQKEYLSPTTLQRIWTYKTGYGRVSVHSLNVLCRYVGSSEWENYCQAKKEAQKVDSEMFKSEGIDVATLKAGTCIRIAWQPDRVCVIRYLGDYCFEAIETQNAKLCTGDKFTCLHIQKGREMVIGNLKRCNEDMSYIVASRNGLTSLEIIEEE